MRGKWAEANGDMRIAREANAGTTIANGLLILADKIMDGKDKPEAPSAKPLAPIEGGASRKRGWSSLCSGWRGTFRFSRRPPCWRLAPALNRRP